MSDLRKSVQKARFESLLNEGEGTKGHRIGLQYTRLDGEKAPQAGSKAVKLVALFSKEEQVLIGRLKPGDELVIEKVENKWTTPEGKEASTWNLHTVRDISTWVEPAPKKPWNGGGGFSKGSGVKSGGYDNLGQQIGNSLTNAIVSLGAGHTVEEYKQRCLELVKAGDWVREQMEGKASSVEKNATVQVPDSTISATGTTWSNVIPTKAEVEDDFFSGLGAVSFD